MKARVAISRRSTNQGDGSIGIAITDDASGILVCDVEMSLSDFAECVTGLAGSQAEFRSIANRYAADRFGKKKIVERVYCDKASGKKEMADQVMSDFSKNYSEEWELWSDGTSSQQNGKQHQYIICKYVETE